MKRGRRFLAGSIGAVGMLAAAGRVAARRRVPPPHDDDLLGSLRGEPETLRGPRASELYAERFPGERGTVILTHGWCLSEAVWHHQKASLAEAGFTVVAWDLPGHGASTPVARGRLTLELAVDSLARVVDRFADPLGTVLVGHSLGGALTLGYLAGHPEAAVASHVRGAAFVSTPLVHIARSVAGRWPGAAIEARALGSVMERIVSNPALDRIFRDGVGDADGYPLSYRVVRVGFGKHASPASVRFVRDIIATVRPEVRVDTWRAMTDYDFRGAARRVKVPSLVVIGARDRLVNPTETHMLTELLPRASEVVFPDAGHAPFLEESEAFDRELRRFLERRFRPSAPRPPRPARGGEAERNRSGSGTPRAKRGRRRSPAGSGPGT